jgi:type IV pilus assembly protein PilY1
MPYSNAANPGYVEFRTANAGRPTMVYVGSNDGMLHAFDGALTGTGAGQEVFAYIPSPLFSGPTGTPQVNGLVALGKPEFSHHFYVNATPQVFDVDFSKTQGNSGSPDWRSVLIGGLGKGGKSYYAIDVTHPETMTSEEAIAARVLWEFTDADLGHTYGEPAVVKTRKYGWTVIFASGYGNADGKGYIFFVNPRNGRLLEKVQVNVGTLAAEAGLAHMAAFVLDLSDGLADAVYGGDLLGNVWRLDITGTSGSYPAPERLASLTRAGGGAQPVTSRPLIEVQPATNKRYVFIGTGRLLAESDIASTRTQDFYAIWDGTGARFNKTADLPTGVSFPITRSNLVDNSDLIAGVAVNPSQPMGWYVELGTGTGQIAWRVISDPTAFFGVVSFAAILPNGSACEPSGSSRVYALDFGSGKSVLTDNATAIAFSARIPGIVTDVRFLSVEGKVRLIGGSDQGRVDTLPGNFSKAAALRRLNWRELPIAN